MQRWYMQVTGDDGAATGAFMKQVVPHMYDPRLYGHCVYIAEADHEAERERLTGLLREWRKPDFTKPAHLEHNACYIGESGTDFRCDLCKRTDAALAKENHHE